MQPWTSSLTSGFHLGNGCCEDETNKEHTSIHFCHGVNLAVTPRADELTQQSQLGHPVSKDGSWLAPPPPPPALSHAWITVSENSYARARFMVNPLLPSVSLEFWNIPLTECLSNHPTIKSLGAESPDKLPWLTTLHT